MKIFVLSVYLMGLSALASAQPRPGAFTTITATSITTTGAGSFGTITGPITVTGFGTSTFSAGGTGLQTLGIRNTTAGPANATRLQIGNDTDAILTILESDSSTYAPTALNFANGSILYGNGVGGVSIAAGNAAGALRFYAGGSTERMRLFASGAVAVGTTTDIGVAGWIDLLNGIDVGHTGAIAFSRITAGVFQVWNAGGSTVLVSADTSGFGMATWGTTASAANANVVNGAAVKLVTSLRAAKHDIEPIALADARRTVMGLRSVLYQSAVDDDQRQWAGFIADDVERVNPVLAVYRPDGALQSVTYDRVPAFLLPVVQDHEARLLALEKALAGR
jgi:hypothetical protein